MLLPRRVLRRAIRQYFFGVFAVLGFAYRRGRRQRSRPAPGAVREILVVRVDLLGDVLLTLPVVEGLRRAYPGARITMLTLPYTAPLALLSPAVDDVIAVDTNRIRTLRGLRDPRTWSSYARTYRTLRSRHIDLGISIYGRMASLCTFLSGAKWTVGYQSEAYPYLLDDPIPHGRHAGRLHEVEYGCQLVAHLGVEDLATHPRLQVSRAATERVAALLKAQGVGSEQTVVAIHAGSVNGSAKRWPPHHWAAFIDNLVARTQASVVLVGAQSDFPIAAQVMEGAQSPVVSLVGETSIEELLAVLDRANLVASGDSGPLHLAVARGRPLLAVYGPTDPRIYGPHAPLAPTVVLRQDLPCSPCYTLAATAECPLGDPICMRLITAPRMAQAAADVLAASSVVS